MTPVPAPSSAAPSSDAPSKGAVLDALIADTARALDVMVQAANTAHAAATHEEMKPENDKDTRGIEAGYLAAGQSARAAELQRTLAALRGLAVRAFGADDAVAVGALVALVPLLDEDEDAPAAGRTWTFVAPAGGGAKVTVGDVVVQVVTPQAPLGDALVGKRVGDALELRAGGKVRTLEIVALV